MKIHARSGTPNTLKIKSYDSAGPAKRHLKTRIDKYRTWAARHNRQLYAELTAIREEIDSIDMTSVTVGETRQWSATDTYTGTTFVFQLEKEYG